MDNLFSTHPDVENRIARLNEMAREMGDRVPAPRAGSDADASGPWSQQRRVAGRGPWG
jgi:heat shock protein HtpX